MAEWQIRVVVSLPHGDALQGVVELGRRWGWDLLDTGLTRGALLEPPAPSGAIVSSLPTDSLPQHLLARNCPVVRIGALPHPQDDRVPSILPDQFAAGRLAAEHFAERGFRQLAHVGQRPWAISQPTHAGFVARARELKLRCRSYRIDTSKGVTAADPEAHRAKFEMRARALGDWLGRLPKPVGILAPHDRRAAELCTVCQANGLAVPDAVALLGVGNDSFNCNLAPVALSSIDPASIEQGREAARLLRRLMSGELPRAAATYVEPAGVISRQSTEILAVSDPRVARALRFIWEHMSEDLPVDAVAEFVGMPRRSLERAFRQALHRGVAEELQRYRLEQFCALLRGTDRSIRELASEVGFRSAEYMHSVFRKRFGVTPRKWRLAAWETGKGPGPTG